MGQLAEAVTTKLSGSGAGTVVLRPGNTRTVWRVQSVQVNTGTNTAEPTATVYLGTATGQALGSTYTGSGDTCSGLDVTLYPGQQLTVSWTGGDAGTTATATAYGSTSTWGKETG